MFAFVRSNLEVGAICEKGLPPGRVGPDSTREGNGPQMSSLTHPFSPSRRAEARVERSEAGEPSVAAALMISGKLCNIDASSSDPTISTMDGVSKNERHRTRPV